jgi:two-component system, OmpR family, response regulator RegX3
MRIAILENDTRAAQLLEGWLRAAGHVPRFFASESLFTREVDAASFDVAILGSVAGDADVTEISAALRKGISAVPLLHILQNGGEPELVAALNAGADDCMASARQFELLARIEALTRRTKLLRPATDELRDGARVTLTPKTYNLAVFLLTNSGKLLSRAYLLEQIWGRDKSASTRTLDTHISRLRTVLGLNPDNGWQLQSVYQHGYRLDRADDEVIPLRTPEAESREVAFS